MPNSLSHGMSTRVTMFSIAEDPRSIIFDLIIFCSSPFSHCFIYILLCPPLFLHCLGQSIGYTCSVWVYLLFPLAFICFFLELSSLTICFKLNCWTDWRLRANRWVNGCFQLPVRTCGYWYCMTPSASHFQTNGLSHYRSLCWKSDIILLPISKLICMVKITISHKW